MKKKSLWLMLTGALCMAFALIASPLLHLSDAVNGFLTGFGVTLMIGALYVENKRRKTAA